MKCKKHGELSEGQYKNRTTVVAKTGRVKTVKECIQCGRDKSKKKRVVDKADPNTDWTGRKYGSLTFVRKINEKHRGSFMWELLCDCGVTIKRNQTLVRNGTTSNCGCKTKLLRSEAGSRQAVFDPVIASARIVWRRVYGDGCSFEDFMRISQLPCTYCGSPPSRIFNKFSLDGRHPKKDGYDFVYNGMDRIDNSKDHSSENVVPCCTQCNTMKMSWSAEQFLGQVEKIYKFNLKTNG